MLLISAMLTYNMWNEDPLNESINCVCISKVKIQVYSKK